MIFSIFGSLVCTVADRSLSSCGPSVSQFTLYGILKGNKPDFHVAMPPQEAKPFYACLVEKFRKAYTADVVKGNKSHFFMQFVPIVLYSCDHIQYVPFTRPHFDQV